VLPLALQLRPNSEQANEVVPKRGVKLEQDAAASPRKALNTFSMMVLKGAYGRANQQFL
jgi:hypothetical protein